VFDAAVITKARQGNFRQRNEQKNIFIHSSAPIPLPSGLIPLSPLRYRNKAVEGYRTPRRYRVVRDVTSFRQVLDCASPLALWGGCRGMRGLNLVASVEGFGSLATFTEEKQ